MERIIRHSLCSFVLGAILLLLVYKGKGKLASDISIVVATIGYELLIFSAVYFLYNVVSCMIDSYKERMSRELIWDTDNGVIRDPETKEAMFDFKCYGLFGIFFDSETKEFLCILNCESHKYFDQWGNIITMNKLDKEWQARKHATTTLAR